MLLSSHKRNFLLRKTRAKLIILSHEAQGVGKVNVENYSITYPQLKLVIYIYIYYDLFSLRDYIYISSHINYKCS